MKHSKEHLRYAHLQPDWGSGICYSGSDLFGERYKLQKIGGYQNFLKKAIAGSSEHGLALQAAASIQ